MTFLCVDRACRKYAQHLCMQFECVPAYKYTHEFAFRALFGGIVGKVRIGPKTSNSYGFVESKHARDIHIAYHMPVFIDPSPMFSLDYSKFFEYLRYGIRFQVAKSNIGAEHTWEGHAVINGFPHLYTFLHAFPSAVLWECGWAGHALINGLPL